MRALKRGDQKSFFLLIAAGVDLQGVDLGYDIVTFFDLEVEPLKSSFFKHRTTQRRRV